MLFLKTGHWSGRHARRLGILSLIVRPGGGICAQDTDVEHV